MSYAIIGFGPIGQALARHFDRAGIDVVVAGRRPPQALAPQAEVIGPHVSAVTVQEALNADTIVLAMPFSAYREVAAMLSDWSGKILIDATNAYGIPVEDLGSKPSSSVVAAVFKDAGLVKAFNHLPAATLASDPNIKGGRRVVFLAGDHADAAAQVAELAERLGFAPVHLGTLAEGGVLAQARNRQWAPLIFQDLVKFI